MKTRSFCLPRRRRSFSNGLSKLRAPVSRRRKLRLEPLESRLLLTTNYLVDSLADVVADDGVITLREAIQAANTDAQVHEAPAGDGHDVIRFDLSLAGETITLAAALGELQITSNLDLLAEDAAGLTIDAAGNSRVFYIHTGVTDAKISDLTITAGSEPSWRGGGGIRNEGTLSLLNSTISNNAADYGGGIANAGTLSVANSTISGNSAEVGGGILNGGTLSVVNSTISDNSAEVGGGIRNEGTLSLLNSTISNNAAEYGGGIANAGTLSVVNSTISGNSAYLGGGIFNGGTLSVVNSTISGNSAQWDGGGIFNEGTLSVVNSTISDNSADYGGGGIWNEMLATLSVVNSTIVENTADADDNGSGDGGGVYTEMMMASTTLHNTIVAGNLRGAGPDDLSGEPVHDGSSHNLVGDAGSSGLSDGDDGNIVGEDPRLAPLGDYGGPTQTHALLPGSPAIDKGNDAQAVDPLGNPLTTDQRGFQRFLDGNGDGTPTVDIGAFEFEPLPSPLVVSSYADEFDGDHRPGDLSLREALALAAINPGKDEIRFAAALAGETITLEAALGELQITSNLDLLADGAPGLTIDAAGNSRVFYIHTAVTDATISDLTITGGSTGWGGGILNEGTLSLLNLTISGNSAEYGGGIRNEDRATLSVTNSTISGNSADGGGGIFNSLFCTLSVVNSTISDNSAEYEGGGIANFMDGTLSVVNSTISDNSAEYEGGGIANFMDGTLSVVNSTIVENTADADDNGSGDGGGVYTDSMGSTTLHNTIVAGNLRGAGPDDLSGEPVQGGSSHNLVGDAGTSGLADGVNGNIVGQEPQLAPLGDYGGPTETHALLPGSPAIDAGDNDRATDAGLTEDQRGLQRFLDGNGDGTPTVDIGAFEFEPLPSPLVVSTFADEFDGDHRPGDLSLREALALAAINPGKDEIRFAAALAGETITLEAALGELQITSDLDLLAEDAAGLTIDAAGNSRVFYIHTGVTDAKISDLTITGGSGVHSGGGIRNEGTLSLVNSTISNNAADYGGGIRNEGTLSVTNSTISDNSADGGGGIFNGGTLSVVNSTISGNSTDMVGGGISNVATLSVVNSTISGNSAGTAGGGIFNADMATLSVVNSTIVENIADADDNGSGDGGGVFTYSMGSTTLHNTIVAGNFCGTAADDFSGDSVQDGSSHNLVGDAGSSGLADGVNGNIVGQEPQLAPLGDYGGPTQTHALLPGSPAIDAGDDARALDPVGNPLTTDQRGLPRIGDGDGDGTARIDIGAVEAVPGTTPRATAGLYDPLQATFHLKNSNTQGGGADMVYRRNAPGWGWTPLAGDWNGDGIETVGLYDPVTSVFYLRDSNNPGWAHVAFRCGPANGGWQPIAGDWNGDGVDTVGLYDRAHAALYLKNSNTQGGADVAFHYGPNNHSWSAIAGDWDHDGEETVGLYDPGSGTFHLKNTHASGPAHASFRLGPAGNAGWQPIAGDWNLDGMDTVGLYDRGNGVLHLKNVNATLPRGADVSFGYGPRNNSWTAVAGDWNKDARDSVGLYDPANSAFHLKNVNANPPGGADVAFPYRAPGGNWRPLAGDWDANGTDTVGLYDPATSLFHLGNSHSTGWGEIVLRFGPAGAGWQPIVGDWNADGADTVGLYDPNGGAFHLKNSHSSAGGADVVFRYGPRGNPGWTAVVGDWNRDGIDSVGLYDPAQGVFHLKNVNADLPRGADIVFRFGPKDSKCTALAGDWNGDAVDTVGLYNSSSAGFYLKNVNANLPGGADVAFRYGPRDSDWIPLAGNWNASGLPLQAAGGQLVNSDTAPLAQADLLTVLYHELGHTLALEDFDSSGGNLMSGALRPGQRRQPGAAELDALFALW